MRGKTTTGSGPEHVDAETLISAFTGMLQVGFLYPANNPRVADVCAHLAETLQLFAPDGAAVEIRAEGDSLQLGAERFTRERPEISWTLDRLDRAGLHGVVFEPALDPQALIELAVALRKSFPPSAPPFTQTWCHDGLGVTPLTDAPLAPVAAPAAAPDPAPPRRTAVTGGADAVLGRLARSSQVRETLGTIHVRFEQEYDGAEHFDAAGMLEKLVSDLPADIRLEPEVASGLVETVLDLLLAQLEVFLLSRPERPGERLAEVASTLLLRRIPTGEIEPAGPRPPANAASPPAVRRSVAPPPAPPRAGPRASPAVGLPLPGPMGGGTAPPERPVARKPTPVPAASRPPPPKVTEAPPAARPARRPLPTTGIVIDDDPTALVDSIDALPRAEDVDEELDGPMLGDELLGAALHLLANGRDGAAVAAGTVRLVEHLMADPTPSQRRILGAYLQLVREGGPQSGDPAARERLVDFLQRNGVQHLMATRETLDVEQVVRTFPTQLLMFLDALELKNPSSEKAFAELLDAVGDEAMLEACRGLIDDGSLLTPNRTEKALKFGGRRAAAIAKELVRTGASWTRAQVVNYLRRQSLSRSESAALAIIQPVTALPPAYLADLCDSVAADETSPKVHGYTSLLLRQYVRDTAETPGDLDRRLYAIRALGHWPSPETVQYLEQLAKEGRFLQQSKEARAIRQAAAESLAQIRAGEVSQR